MAIAFRKASAGALADLTAEVPSGAIIGVIGEDSPALETLLRLAAGLQLPERGDIVSDEPRRLLGWNDPINLSPVNTLVLEHALAPHDALVRARARVGLERLRGSGCSIVLLSHEPELLRQMCDEVWWIHEGRLAFRGDPREALGAYAHHISGRLSEWATAASQPLEPSLRRGDGRAKIVTLETLSAECQRTIVWRSGEPVAVRVAVRFEQAVDDPVVGVMIRTRIGFEVFGTNTELEQLRLGPVAAGEMRVVEFRFVCNLCPQEYTLTAASHDPDGVWHDWMEDAIAFSVTAPRYTAGVADLRATAHLLG
jgi:ABC-type thiamine transport system ATPase subunit